MVQTAIHKQRFVADLQPGDLVDDLFMLSSARQGQAKNGPYWHVFFQDASGTIEGKIWSPLSLEFSELPAGEPFFVAARVTTYRERAELAISGMRALSVPEKCSLSLADFMPSSPHDIEEMYAELRALCRSVFCHKPLAGFMNAVLDHPEIGPLFKVAPAAKTMHHAYAGGLLEHTLSVAKVAMTLAGHYPQLDRQILLAGAICHDLGKIWELSSGLVIDYTDQGRLLGHITLALERLTPIMRECGLENHLIEHLQHLVLSHHGTLEFGSPKLPATAEAIVLHYADNIDAKLQQVGAALAGLGEEAGWSTYNKGLERFLFKAQQAETPEPLFIAEAAPSSPPVSAPLDSAPERYEFTDCTSAASAFMDAPQDEEFSFAPDYAPEYLPDDDPFFADAPEDIPGEAVWEEEAAPGMDPAPDTPDTGMKAEQGGSVAFERAEPPKPKVVQQCLLLLKE